MMKISHSPQLRFPEFEYDLVIEKAGSFFKNRKESGEKGLPLYSVTIDQGLINRNELDRNIISETKPNSNLRAKPQDLVYNMMRMWQGAIGFCTEECMISPAYVVLKPTSNIDSRYFFYFFKSHKGLYILKSQSYGLTEDRLRLYYKDFREIKLFKPKFEEQQKIATFLSTIDKKIEQLTKKKKLLEEYKKGVMQKIFPKPWETHPKLRFKRKNGAEFPDWKTKKLGEIGETFNGLTGKTKEDFGSGAPYINYKQVFDHSKIISDKFDYVKIDADENQNEVKFGDVIFTTTSETRLEVGFTSVFLEEIENVYLNSFCFGFRINSHNELSPEFARFLFRSEGFRQMITRLGQGSTRYNLSKKEVTKLIISFPEKEEQNKIAEFLSNLTNRIVALEDKIHKAQIFKKGLLQQMFV